MQFVSNVLGMLGLSGYILADTFFVSAALGTTGLAALNLAIPIYSLIHGCGLMLGTGGATRYAIRRGTRPGKQDGRIFLHTLMLAAILAAFFFVLGLSGSGCIAHLLGANEAVFDMSRTYLQTLLLFSPAFLLNEVSLGFIRSDGAPQYAMAAMLAGSFSNIILDYVFPFLVPLGIFGAVLATCLAPIISLLILLPRFLKGKCGFVPTRKCSFLTSRKYVSDEMMPLEPGTGESLLSGCSQILASGFPSLVAELSSGIVMIAFNKIILELAGNTGVAAYGVIANLSLVMIAIFTGIAQAVQPLLAGYHGMGQANEFMAIRRYAFLTTLLLAVIIYLCIFFQARPISEIFNSEGNPLLTELAAPGMKLYFTSAFFAGFNLLLTACFTAREQVLSAGILSLLRGFLLILPMAFLLSSLWKLTGLWLAFPVTELLVCLLGAVLTRKGKNA